MELKDLGQLYAGSDAQDSSLLDLIRQLGAPAPAPEGPPQEPYSSKNPIPDPGIAAAKALQRKFMEYGPGVNAKLHDLVDKNFERMQRQP